MEYTTKELFKDVSQIEIFLYVFILQNKNRCISSIINEIPTTFWLMKKFEVTVKKYCMFFPTLILIIFYITCTYVHSIVDFSKNTGCSPGFSLYSRYWSHFHNISFTWGIFYLRHFCIFKSSRRSLSVQFKFIYVFSNIRGIINNSVL